MGPRTAGGGNNTYASLATSALVQLPAGDQIIRLYGSFIGARNGFQDSRLNAVVLNG